MKYQGKQFVIEAFQAGVDDNPPWFVSKILDKTVILLHPEIQFGNFFYNPKEEFCFILTERGRMTINNNDFVVKDINGNIYSYSPEEFKKTYDLIS